MRGSGSGASSPRNLPPIGAKTLLWRRSRAGHLLQLGGEVPSNNVQRFREALMMSKAELARKAGLSTLTIDRVEAGRPCRLDTKRKVLLALGLNIRDKDRVFGDSPDEMPGADMAGVSEAASSGRFSREMRS